MNRIIARTAVVSVLGLFVLAGQAAAQDTVLTADPATVPEAGSYTFTVTGSDFIPNSSGVNVLPCTLPGDPLTPQSSEADIGAAMGAVNPIGGDCNLGGLKPVSPDGDGNFSVEMTVDVGINFAFLAGEADGSQGAFVLVFIVPPGSDDMADDMADDMGDDMAPEGGAETGFGGTAGSGGNSVAVPLAATLAAVILLGGAALITRRNA